MKLLDAILISATVGFLLIFTDQLLRLKKPLFDIYYILMLAMACFLALAYFRKSREPKQKPPQNTEKSTKTKKGK
jgi:hypothetical protein